MKVICGGRPGSMSIICGLVFGRGGVRGTDTEERGKDSLVTSHLMIIEHLFAPFITRHICHWVLLPPVVHRGYTACEGKADACVVIVPYWSFFFLSVSVGRWKSEKERKDAHHHN